MKTTQPVLLLMAGGTGGHIMPGLAVAKELQQRGWHVVWLGNPEKMEGKLVPAQDIELLPLKFSGLRGKGLQALLKLPFTLIKACLQANKAIKKAHPDVVLGMGGYVSVPGGIVTRVKNIPLVVHEQNAVIGSANRLLAKGAKAVLSGFPGIMPAAKFVGNPVRREFLSLSDPQVRYQGRQGQLKVLVVGGSLGATALNETVPKALALLPADQRPLVTHQAGEKHLATLEAHYKDSGVQAKCVAFIDDMASEMAEADLLICRAGAMTVAEVAAAGVAALFVPLPGAIDDHQRYNANWLVNSDAASLMLQPDFNPNTLSQWLSNQNRETLMTKACNARKIAKTEATQLIADKCEQYVKEKNEA